MSNLYAPWRAKPGRPRRYQFAMLAIGEKMLVPVDRTGRFRCWHLVACAARQYRDTHDPRFTWAMTCRDDIIELTCRARTVTPVLELVTA